MNALKSVFILTSILFMSGGVMAHPLPMDFNYNEIMSNENIDSKLQTSKQAAYNAGLQKLKDLESLAPQKLAKELNIFGFDVDTQTTHLENGGYVTVEERMTEAGKMAYIGVANVKVHYAELTY